MDDDAALLRQYLDERSEAAFAALVRRHVALVYTVALRRTRHEPAAAGELTQEVFSDLAMEASAVSRQSVVVGWLHAATLRHAPEAAAGDAHSLAHALDTALAAMADDDRSALLLRYFERRPLAEISRTLNLSEAAAELCVRRALDKLRGRLSLLGHRLGSAALLTAMEQQHLVSAPAELADRIPDAAISAVALAEVTGRGSTWLASLIAMINSGPALGVAAAIVVGGALFWGYRTNARLEAEITRLRGESQVIAGLQRENRRLVRLVNEAEDLKKEVVELPALRAKLRPTDPPPASGTVSITIVSEEALRWDNEDITPAEFLERLRSFRARYPAIDSSVFVRGTGATLSAITYVVNESRKAGIKQILVEGEPRVDGGGWF
jgi:DNA-directed RNA polymerase specialized sigma24 family protein